jgi:hypothetical protein
LKAEWQIKQLLAISDSLYPFDPRQSEKNIVHPC